MAEGKKFVPGKGMVPVGKAGAEGKKGAVPPKKGAPVPPKKGAPAAKPGAKKPMPPKKK
jgi:hypothetical protein